MKKLLLILMFLPNYLFADLPDLSPFSTFQPISKSHFNQLLDSIVSGEKFFLPDVPGRPAVTGTPWRDWAANSVSLQGDITSIRLHFVDAGQQEDDKDSTRAPSFEVEVAFEDQEFIADSMALFSGKKRFSQSGADSFAVVIKHSRAAEQREVAGVSLQVTEKRANRFYFRGLDQTGVAIFIPKTERTGFAGRGMLICPRNFDVWRIQHGLRKLPLSNYKLEAVSYEAEAKMQGRVVSGLGPGYAKATIQTSETLPANLYPIDESFSAYPFVSLDYTADPDSEPVTTLKNSQSTAGLEMDLVLNNSFSHKTTSSVKILASVRTLNLQAAQGLMFKQKQFSIEPGECVALVKEILLEQVHEKEALPEMSRKTDTVEELIEEGLPGQHLFDDQPKPDSKKETSPLDEILK